MSQKTTDNTNTFESSYNDLSSEIQSTETSSITFGSSEISASEIPSTTPISTPKNKIKLFNFKFVEPDTSYIEQESTESSQFIREQDESDKAEIDREEEVKTEDQKDEQLEESIVSTEDDMPFELPEDTEIEIPDFGPEPETETEETIEEPPENEYNPPDLPDMPEMQHQEPPEETEPEEVNEKVISTEVSEVDPDAGKSFSQMWTEQVSLVTRAAGGDSKEPKPKNETKTQYAARINARFSEFKNKDDSKINGYDTLLGFLTIMVDKIATIFESIIFFGKNSVRYMKGDKTWNRGIGRIFTIFVIGVLFFILFKYLF